VSTETLYDQIEYAAQPFLQAQPDRLATMARLFGVDATAVSNSRVLEIGCGDGLNLIASAVALPGAQFHGLDLSEAAIARGREMVESLGLENVHLSVDDLRSLDGSSLQFDYVIAHGLYSWVPPDVRDALLKVTARVLAPRGVAFISYNSYPGAYLRQIARDFARFHARSSAAPAAQVQAAREALEAIQPGVPSEGLHSAAFIEEAAQMLARDDGGLFHDDLARFNQPVYFHQFIEHAAQHGLQFLAEAELTASGIHGLSPQATKVIERFASTRIETEQYADFLRGRRFRQTLLCRSGIPVLDAPEPERVEELYVGGPITVTEQAGEREYASALGGRISTADRRLQSILDEVVTAWPSFLRAGDLVPGAGDFFLELFAAKLVDLRTTPPPVATQITEKPKASPLARFQSESGASPTSLHHFDVKIESTSLRAVLLLADGTRDRTAMIRDLGQLFRGAKPEQVAYAVDQHLNDLLRNGLLLNNAE
jgi:SAM-dependent methyltransferase